MFVQDVHSNPLVGVVKDMIRAQGSGKRTTDRIPGKLKGWIAQYMRYCAYTTDGSNNAAAQPDLRCLVVQGGTGTKLLLPSGSVSHGIHALKWLGEVVAVVRHLQPGITVPGYILRAMESAAGGA